MIFGGGVNLIHGYARREIPEHPVIKDMERFGYVRGWRSPHPTRLTPGHLPPGGKALGPEESRGVSSGRKRAIYILQVVL